MGVTESRLEDYAYLLSQAGSELEDQLVRELCEESLHEFVKEFWHIVEPGRPFVDNWHLRWMCAELQAITAGETTHLLMNVPPGAMKSLLLVFWTAWEWGPKNSPTLRYLCASYTQTLTIRDNRRRKAIISDERYKRLWPHVKIDQNRTSDENFGNTSTGWCIATSTGGVGTGERADRVICFPADEVVHTEHGPMKIGEIVRERRDISVWSTDVRTGETTLKPITGWHTNPGSRIIEVGFSDGSSVRCTPGHRIWTRRGWVEANSLCSSDVIPSESILNERHHVFGEVKAPRQIGLTIFGYVDFFSDLCRDFMRSVFAFGRYTGAPSSYASPGTPVPYVVYCPCADAVPLSQCGGGILGCHYVANSFIRKFCIRAVFACQKSAMFLRICDIFNSRAPRKVVQREITRIAVKVSGIFAERSRANKKFQQQNVHPEHLGCIANCGIKTRIPIAVWRCLKNFLRHIHGRWRASFAFSGGDSGVTFGASKVADAVEPFKTRDRTPFFIWEVGDVHETFCLSVRDNHTFYVGKSQAVLVANCDDAHSVNTAESDAVRAQTLHWWREVVPTRVNDPQKSAFIVVMQRVHSDDVAGDILDNRGAEWVHVMIPMRYEPDRHCATAHGEDPRGLDEDGNLLPGMLEPGIVEPDSPLARRAGKLYWPERFPEWTVVRDSIPLGRYGVASQFQQMPSPRGGGIILDAWWQIWPPADEFEKWVRPTLLDDGRIVKVMSFPPAEFTVAYVDTAFTEKDVNAYCAMTCFDVFADNEGHPKVMLRNAWQEHPTLKQLCDKILETCRRHRVDCLVIENKAGAPWVKQEMQRLMRKGEFSIVLDEPRSDKVARLHSVAPLFEDGIVYAPNRDWADLVIKQTSEFPKGKYKDLVDCLSGSLGYLRRNDLIKLAVEHDEEERDKKIFRGNKEGIAGLYEVN